MSTPVARHEVQVRRFIYEYVDAVSVGGRFTREVIRSAVEDGLRREGQSLRHRKGDTGTMSDGISRTLSKMERYGVIAQVSDGRYRRLAEASDGPEQMLTFIRERTTPPTTSRVEKEAPPMHHKQVLYALQEVGLVWRVGSEWIASEPSSLDQVLLTAAGMALHKHRNSEGA